MLVLLSHRVRAGLVLLDLASQGRQQMELPGSVEDFTPGDVRCPTLTTPRDTTDHNLWRTEIASPIIDVLLPKA